MSRSAVSILVFAIYLFGMGVILLIVPNVLLSLLSVPETSEVWVRVVGMLALVLGFYYATAARNELTPFFRATVYGRTSVLFFFVGFVVLEMAQPIFILFGAIDVAVAAWTAICLRSDSKAAAGEVAS